MAAAINGGSSSSTAMWSASRADSDGGTRVAARSSRPAARSGSRPASGPADPVRCRWLLAGTRGSCGRSWCSVSALNTRACDRTAGGTLGSSRGSIRARASGTSPASIRKPAPTNVRRTRAASSSGGVSRTASAESTAAASGAPRSAAASAARSTTSAIASSGVDVASARWRACCSRSSTSSATCRCTARRRAGDMPKYTAAPSSGCVKRTTSSLPTAIAPAATASSMSASASASPSAARSRGRGRALDRRDELEQRPRFVRKSLDSLADELLERGWHR